MTRHIVIVGRFSLALDAWEGRLVSLRRCGMVGVDEAGREIWFVSVSNPDRLRGARAESFEFSACALEFGSPVALRRYREIMAARGIEELST